MKQVALVVLGCWLGACGFKFAVGSNPYGGPLTPIKIKDVGGQGVGESLRRHLPAKLAQAGLTRGAGQARLLTVVVAPWERVTLYNTLDGRAVVFGERFTVKVTAEIQGKTRRVRVSEIVNLNPTKSLENRALNLQRLADHVGLRLAAKLAEALE